VLAAALMADALNTSDRRFELATQLSLRGIETVLFITYLTREPQVFFPSGARPHSFLSLSKRCIYLLLASFIVFLDRLRATALPTTRYHSWAEDLSVTKRPGKPVGKVIQSGSGPGPPEAPRTSHL